MGWFLAGLRYGYLERGQVKEDRRVEQMVRKRHEER